jgi:hypothetical protein
MHAKSVIAANEPGIGAKDLLKSCAQLHRQETMALKRFLVFAFDPAAAAGGWRDYKGDADSKEEAERIAEQQHGRIQIVDTEYEEKVAGVNAHLVYTLYREYEYHQH